MGDAEIGLDGDGGGGEGLVGGRGGKDDEVDVFRLQPGVFDCRPGGGSAHGRGELAFAGDPPLLDAGALGDPVVGGIDDLGEVLIGQHPLRQVSTASLDHRPHAINGTFSQASCRAFELELGVETGDVACKTFHHAARRHVIGEIDGGGEAGGVGAAMAFHDNAV